MVYQNAVYNDAAVLSLKIISALTIDYGVHMLQAMQTVSLLHYVSHLIINGWYCSIVPVLILDRHVDIVYWI